MIEIHVRNVYSVLSDYTEELEQLLAVYKPNYWFTKGYKEGWDDGRYHFLKLPTCKFPTGLLSIVIDYFKEKNIEHKVFDHRSLSKDTLNLEIIKADYLNEITLRNYQIEAINSAIKNGRGIIELATGLGKAQPLDSKIYTPTGVTYMRDIKIGDEVVTPNGSTAKVIGVFPQGKLSIYQIGFSNGDTVECTENHLWKVASKINWKHHQKIIELKDIFGKYIKNKRPIYQIYPITNISFKPRKVKIDPYLMGILLGDGKFGHDMIGFSNKDEEILNSIRKIIPLEYELKPCGKYDYYIAKCKRQGGKSNYYLDAIRYYGLENKHSDNKFIPLDYKYNSKEVRLSILQGLMDTDGYMPKNGAGGAEFYSTSKQLANDVKEIAESLGYICRIKYKTPTYLYKGKRKIGKRCYVVYISGGIGPNIFRLQRKKLLFAKRNGKWNSRMIQTIKYVGKKECCCILLNNQEHMYVTDNFIPTHNTEVAIATTKFLEKRTLFLVHRKELLNQTYERYKKRLSGKSLGKIGDSNEIGLDSDIVIATFQTLDSWFNKNRQRFKQFLNSFYVGFWDECHHASSTTFYRVGMYMHNCHYRFGLSGTPFRRDNLANMKLMAITGPIVYSKLAKEGIDEGHLSDIEVRILDSHKPLELEAIPLSWQREYEYGIVRHEGRNQKIVYTAKDHFTRGDRVLILVRMIEHGKILQRMLSQGQNVPAVFLHGISETWKREKMKKRFNDKGDFIMISSSIFSEGVDIPEINVLIKASGGKAEAVVIQETGRGLRKKKDGGRLIVYDFNDIGWKYLSKHSKRRIEIYRNEEYLK